MRVGLVMSVLFAWTVAAVAATTRGDVILAEQGKSDYAIIMDEHAGPATKHAADELRKFLAEISGAHLPIQPNSPTGSDREILIGDSAAVRAVIKDLDLKSLGEEGYILRTVGNRVLIVGGSGRGDLYGVYGLLRDHFGCRWFTPKVSRIPKLQRVVVAELNERKIPALEYREVMAFDCWDADWMARNHLNTTKLLDDKHGGAVKYVPDYYVHTFGKLVPADAYFEKHPEYFAEVGGKRVKDGLCATSDEVIGIVTERVRTLLREHPDCKVISVSQNDDKTYCACPNCAAVDEAEGSHAGQVLYLVNRVAEAIEKEFPDRAVETLAYEWSRTPPKTIKPRANVIVRLSTIQCSFGDPLETSRQGANRAFCKELEGWAAICNRLWIWDYTSNFSYYLLPFPNQQVMDDNVRFFVKNHVKGIVEQGNWQSPGGAMSGLKGYLAATYLWDPAYDEKTATQEFLEGVYGKAAGPIGSYLDLLANEVTRRKIAMPIYGSRTPAYLTKETLEASDALWDYAEAAVAEKPDILKRVRAARLSHDYAYIEHWRWKPENMVTYDGDPKKGKVLALDPGYERHLRRFLEVGRSLGVTNIREGKADWTDMEKWLKMLLRDN